MPLHAPVSRIRSPVSLVPHRRLTIGQDPPTICVYLLPSSRMAPAFASTSIKISTDFSDGSSEGRTTTSAAPLGCAAGDRSALDGARWWPAGDRPPHQHQPSSKGREVRWHRAHDWLLPVLRWRLLFVAVRPRLDDRFCLCRALDGLVCLFGAIHLSCTILYELFSFPLLVPPVHLSAVVV
ncbi:hypothetical protein C8Q77DRAFT_393035 [Trametes polyzona]|nr:hypothetical protein C8Q77DRAFT_393035 [Trametes polyzona]